MYRIKLKSLQNELDWYKEKGYYNSFYIKKAQDSLDNKDITGAESSIKVLQWQFSN